MTRKRRNFSKATLIAAFARCGGRCEGTLESGARCNTVLIPGRWAGDHINADALTGEPTLENCACLCNPCHKVKTTTKDVPAIAQAKRRQAAHVGAELPKAKIRSAGFPKPERKTREQLPMPPRRSLFARTT